jgi:1-acyl-sn-glycerol-3-phosphate acyltransferase
MNRRPLRVDGRRWHDRISPACIGLTRPFRRWVQRRTVRLARVEVRGVERLRRLVEGGAGVLLTPNHSSHADRFTAMELSDAAGLPFHIMVAADVFVTSPPLIRWVMQRHGCFSIDRHGTDLRAFKRAMEVLLKGPHPLLVFAEGEVYHLNDHVTPFRVGPAMMALTAAKRSKRPIHCVPCAFKYYYTRDPTPELERVMARLEERVNWRPAPETPLVDRILRYGNGQIALKEVEHLGRPQHGTRRERLGRLRGRMLGRLEARLGLEGKGTDPPERVKAVRQVCMDRLGKEGLSADERREVFVCLDETFVIIQAYLDCDRSPGVWPASAKANGRSASSALSTLCRRSTLSGPSNGPSEREATAFDGGTSSAQAAPSPFKAGVPRATAHVSGEQSGEG